MLPITPKYKYNTKKVEEFISAPPRVCPLDLAYKLLHSSKVNIEKPYAFTRLR